MALQEFCIAPGIFLQVPPDHVLAAAPGPDDLDRHATSSWEVGTDCNLWPTRWLRKLPANYVCCYWNATALSSCLVLAAYRHAAVGVLSLVCAALQALLLYVVTPTGVPPSEAAARELDQRPLAVDRLLQGAGLSSDGKQRPPQPSHTASSHAAPGCCTRPSARHLQGCPPLLRPVTVSCAKAWQLAMLLHMQGCC